MEVEDAGKHGVVVGQTKASGRSADGSWVRPAPQCDVVTLPSSSCVYHTVHIDRKLLYTSN